MSEATHPERITMAGARRAFVEAAGDLGVPPEMADRISTAHVLMAFRLLGPYAFSQRMPPSSSSSNVIAASKALPAVRAVEALSIIYLVRSGRCLHRDPVPGGTPLVPDESAGEAPPLELTEGQERTLHALGVGPLCDRGRGQWAHVASVSDFLRGREVVDPPDLKVHGTRTIEALIGKRLATRRGQKVVEITPLGLARIAELQRAAAPAVEGARA